MKITPFKEEHREVVREWFSYYGLPREMGFPEVGFIAEDEKPLAASFLRKIEGGHGLFDGLIANPEASGKKRNEALNAVVLALIEEARLLGIQKIIAYSSDTAVVRRSLKHGFELQPDSLIALAV